MTATIQTQLCIAADASEKIQNRLDAIAKAIDGAEDAGDTESLMQADGIIDSLLAELNVPQHQATLLYYRANLWSACRKVKDTQSAHVWEWEHEEAEREIYYLRCAAYHPGFSALDPLRQCQIETNLANLLSSVGRLVDAIPYWDSAIRRLPRFAMALANRGIGLTHYARVVYDGGHAGAMLLAAFDDLSSALRDDALFDSPESAQLKADFSYARDQIASVCSIPEARSIYEKMEGTICKSKAEKSYRRWCLENRLFLNPLNDLAVLKNADYDVLSVPSYVSKIGEPPTPTRLFNIMKQEYVSARFLFYEGLNRERPHYSDRGVFLYNTLDYPALGIGTEQVKCAFRMTYSLFDKIAEFINLYWTLKANPRRVSLRRIWYRREGEDFLLREEFRNYENWPLRGLFWLSRDLFDKADGFREHTEPESRDISDLRHRLEHGFLSIHGLDWTDSWGDEASNSFLSEKPGRSLRTISRSDFARKTLRVLQLARSALIYLVVAMNREEQIRAQERDADSLCMPMNLDRWEDDWKR